MVPRLNLRCSLTLSNVYMSLIKLGANKKLQHTAADGALYLFLEKRLLAVMCKI